jgi:casein kinase 1
MTYIGLNLLNNQSVAIKFEPRKSDAPQLRDEYRTYKVLAGLRKV